MSAWIRSVTGRAYHFEPLNAKQLERPNSRNGGLDDWIIGVMDCGSCPAGMSYMNPVIHLSINPFLLPWV